MSASVPCLPPFFRDRWVMVAPWCFLCVFCACFVLFERSMKLKETAIELESFQAA